MTAGLTSPALWSATADDSTLLHDCLAVIFLLPLWHVRET